MPQYKNYAGQTVTCPKQEGTCWQPDHLTKEQIRIQRTKNDNGIRSVSAGIDGATSWVEYDSYAIDVQRYEKENGIPERPTHTAGKAIYDMASEALGLEGVIVEVNYNEEDGRYGNVVFGTGEDEEGMLDGVRYEYETRDGETTFYKKKSFGRREEVNHITIQKDAAKARSIYNRIIDARAASSG